MTAVACDDRPHRQSPAEAGGISVRLVVTVLLGIVSSIVGLVILYYVIRIAVRDGIMDASRKRRQAAAEAAVGWDPQPGGPGG